LPRFRSGRFTGALTLASVCALALLAPALPAGASSRLLAYYGYWDKESKPAYSAAQIPFNQLTHIFHSNLVVESTGGIEVPKGFLEPALLSGAHAAGVKVIVDISGPAKDFAEVAASGKARAAFAQNALAFVKKYGYDGVDIDWEVPSAKATANCTAFFAALRAALPAQRYLLSLAIPADPRSYGRGFDVPKLAAYVDFFNVMTYDFTGPWGSYAGHNSPLYQSPNDPGQEGSLATSMALFTSGYGVSPAQLNIGTAFYGYLFNGYGSLWQSCNGRCGNPVKTVTYAQVKQQIAQGGWTAYFDETADAPYLLHTAPNDFVTYDDTTSTMDKVAYAIGQQGFGGVFMWELSQDYDGTSQDLMSAMSSEFSVVRESAPTLPYAWPRH
jgi:chitinase